MTTPPDARFELKAAFRASALPWIESHVRVHPAGFCVSFPPRWVSSVYFDSPDLASYEQNLSGISRRTKARLRWYGKGWRIEQGAFELKSKQASLVWKRSQQLADTYDLQAHTWSELLGRLRSERADGVGEQLRLSYWPIVIIRYKRQYYLSSDGVVRLTVDSDLCAYDQQASSRPNLSLDSVRRDWSVIELKAPAAQRDRVAEVTAAFPFRTGKHSKYARGVMVGFGCL